MVSRQAQSLLRLANGRKGRLLLCTSLLDKSQIVLLIGLEQISRLIPSILKEIFKYLLILRVRSDSCEGHSVVYIAFIWEVLLKLV